VENFEKHLPINMTEVLRLRAINSSACDSSAKRFAQDDGFAGDDSKQSVAVAKEWLHRLRAEKIDKVTTSRDDGFTGAWNLTG
jgi:hypothetical protein